MQSSDEEDGYQTPANPRKARDDILRNGFPACDEDFIRDLHTDDGIQKKDCIRAMDWDDRTFDKHARTIRAFLRAKTGVSRAYFCEGPPTDLKRRHDSKDVLVCRATESNICIWQLYVANKKQNRPYIDQAVAKTIANIPDFLCISADDYLRNTTKLDDDIIERPCPDGLLRTRIAEKLVLYHIDKMQLMPLLRESRTEGQVPQRIELHPSVKAPNKESPRKKTMKKQFSGFDLYIRKTNIQNPTHYVEIQRLVPEDHRVKVNGDIRIKHATFENFLSELQDRDLPYSAETGYFEYNFGDGKKALVDDTTALQKMLKTANLDGRQRFELVWSEGKAPPKGEHYLQRHSASIYCRNLDMYVPLQDAGLVSTSTPRPKPQGRLLAGCAPAYGNSKMSIQDPSIAVATSVLHKAKAKSIQDPPGKGFQNSRRWQLQLYTSLGGDSSIECSHSQTCIQSQRMPLR